MRSAMAELQPDDRELVALLAREDLGALESLYDRYSALTFALAFRMTGDRETAEDIVQESFLNVWRYAASYDPSRSSPRSWLLSIVRHRCIDRIRKRAVRPQTAWDEDVVNRPSSSDVWEDVARTMTRDDVRRALEALPPEQRETLELAYFDGLTHVEIARKMNVPLGTVKGRIRIALQRLRTSLVGMEPDLLT